MGRELKEGLGSYLAETRCRANQNYELVLFDRLPESEQKLLEELQKQPNFYGILRPKESSRLSIKSVSQDTALLYLSLQEPGVLPAYARAACGDDYEMSIARLVIDQILEIETSDGFVSGSDAYELFYGNAVVGGTKNRIGELSVMALKYGQALAITDMVELSMRLYNYHRLPISSKRRMEFSGPTQIAKLLGVDQNGRHRSLLSKHWRTVQRPNNTASQPHVHDDSHGQHDPSAKLHDGNKGSETIDENFEGWLSWNAVSSPMKTDRQDSTFKLYISPEPDFIKDAFDISFQTLAGTEAFHLKVGAIAEGLLRPDKMVAYFSSYEKLQTAAEVLSAQLDGCPPHGVPFTAELSGNGLLSWGVDPPDSKRLLSWQPIESWRLWLTNRLANALLAARDTPSTNGGSKMEPWQYALERMSLEGVETESWTPAAAIWQK